MSKSQLVTALAAPFGDQNPQTSYTAEPPLPSGRLAAKKLGRSVVVSANLPANSPGLQAFAEKALATWFRDGGLPESVTGLSLDAGAGPAP